MFFFLSLLIYLTFQIQYVPSVDRTELTIFGADESVENENVKQFCNFGELNKVTINIGITQIGVGAFKDAQKLAEVILPSENLKILKSGCFSGCVSLTAITIPEDVHTIENSVFYNCKKIQIIRLPSSLNIVRCDETFKYLELLQKFDMPKNGSIYSVSSDGKMLIKSNTSAVSYIGDTDTVTIPSEIEILESAFLDSRSKIKRIDFLKNSSLKIVKATSFTSVGIRSITFPEGLEEIEGGFLRWTTVTYLSLPSTLIKVGSIFQTGMKVIIAPNCSALTQDKYGVIYNSNMSILLFIPSNVNNFTIPESVLDLSSGIIRSNSNIIGLYSHPNHTKYMSYKNAIYENNISRFSFLAGGVTTAYVHENCTEIGSGAFQLTKVSKVVFEGNKVTKFFQSAFQETYSLLELDLPPNLQSTSSYCFHACAVQRLTFPSTYNSMGGYAFLTSRSIYVNFSNCVNLKSLPVSSFESSEVQTIVLPPQLKILSKDCFSGCRYLLQVSLPTSVTTIPTNCFKDCLSLISVVFEGEPNITMFSELAFSNTNITRIRIPSFVEIVERNCFKGCSQLVNVTFEENSSLKSVQFETFNGCEKIEEIKFGKHLEKIETEALTGMYGLKVINVFESNNNFECFDGVLYEKDTHDLVVFPPGIKAHRLNQVTKGIKSYAFFKCKKLETLSFGTSNVKTIGSNTFLGCTALSSIEIPGETEKLQSLCFSGCTNLSKVTFGENSKITILESGAFDGCESLTSVQFKAGSELRTLDEGVFSGCIKLSLFEFPSKIQEIKSKAFYGCKNLEKLNFGKASNLETIGEESFYGCSSLNSIHFPSSLTKLGKNAFLECTKLNNITYCGEKKLSETAFNQNIELNAYVSVRYPQDAETFGGLPVIRVLDNDCHFGSEAFTLSGAAEGIKGVILTLLEENSD